MPMPLKAFIKFHTKGSREPTSATAGRRARRAGGAVVPAELHTMKMAASMASMKLGSKSEVFHRQGQTWNCNNGLPTDLVVEIGEASFHLHKFPLLSRSGVLEKKIAELSGNGDSSTCTLQLNDLPGGAKSFEVIAKFCYGVKLELTAHNVVGVRCAAEQLQMTEEYGEGNLILHAENFIQELLGNWRDSLSVLEACEEVLAHCEQLHIVTRCITSLAVKATADPNQFVWPVGGAESGGRSPSAECGEVWNGISTSSSKKKSTTCLDWWYEDVSNLSLPLYKRFIAAVESRGMKPDFVAGSLVFYAKRHLPGLNRGSNATTSASAYSEPDQRTLLEEVVSMLPSKKGVTSTKLLLLMLRTAMILHAGAACRESLEKRVGGQLDDAALEDLLITNMGDSNDTLYDVECVQRILDHFMLLEQSAAGDSPGTVVGEEDQQLTGASPSASSAMGMVSTLMDGYLAEVAPDANLRFPTFQSLAATMPDYARAMDDGLYRAIDIYLKAHPWLTDAEREQLCRLMNCQKLSLEACTHAAQNERLPLRMVVQVLFFEQLRLRTSIASWFFVSNNLDAPPVGNTTAHDMELVRQGADRDATAVPGELSVADMRARVSELEQECSSMKMEIEKIRGKGKSSTTTTTTTTTTNTNTSSSSSSWSILPKRLRLKGQPFCSGEEVPVECQRESSGGALKSKAPQLEYVDH